MQGSEYSKKAAKVPCWINSVNIRFGSDEHCLYIKGSIDSLQAMAETEVTLEFGAFEEA